MTDQEKVVLAKTAELWNEFMKLPKQHPDEVNEFRSSIHRLQDIIAVRIARKIEPDFFVTYIISE